MAPELLCGRCEETLCPLDYVVLAEVPPSQVHLAVDFRRPDAESHAEGTLRKIPNDATGRKGADRCPYHLHCRSCESDVGKITKVADRQLFCFKTERVRFKIGGRKLDVAKKLKNVKDRLLSCGVCAVEVAPTPSCCERNESDLFPLIYGDVTGIREEDVDLLTRHTPRDYQLEIFKQALSGNSLVCLPTGSGKTLVAAMVISCMTSINPGKFAVFVVDKVPLAHQQYDYLKKQVPRLELKVITGEPELKDEQKDRRSEDEDWTAGKVDVLVLTHQILLNMLTSQSVRMSDISVLVIDEAHHCCKNHPYKKIMEMYKDTADELKPLVLALTASPVDERTKERSIEKLEELLSNLCVPSLLLGRGLDWTHPEVACEPVPLTSQQRLLKAHVEVYVKALSQQVENFAHSPGTLQGIDVFSTNFRGAMWKLLDQHHGLKFKKAQALGEHTIQVVTSNEISNILGLEFALQSLNDCFSRLEFASTPMERTKKAIVAIPERRLGNADVYNGYSNLRDFVRRSVSHREGAFSNPSSGRFRQLKREIDKFVSRVKEGKSSRGIVFVKMRKTAYDLCEQLKKVPGLNEALRPTYFVGHGQGSDGMDWKAEQQEVLRKFRFGKIKLLISTNVLEEGIDVPVCNLVIRFDSDLTLRSLVQGRGRASRRADSKFVIICEEEETKKFRDVMAMERDMEEAAATVHRRRGSPPDQAFLWGCERKRPDLSRLRAARGALRPPHNQGVSEAEKYTPRIKVTVHNVATDEDRMKVTRFFHDHFEVSSLIPRREVRKMHFDLEARAGDGKEHRSKEDFYNLVTETWCSTLSPPEAEPDRFWLQRNEPYSGKKSKTPVLLLPARCLSIGYFVHQTHFCRQWPETNCLRRVNASFEHDLRIFTVNFTAPTRENGHQRYKAEIFYSELEDFLLIDRGKHLEKSADLFISLRRPPRLFRQVNGGGVEDGESDSDDSAFEDSSSDSEYETDEEFPDEQAHGHESGHPEIPAESATWERVPRVGESSGDWGECLVYHLVLDPGTWVRVSKLLGSLGRFDKKVQFAAVKVQQRRLPAVRLPPGLPFDVHYSVRCLVSSHPVVRARISGLFGHLLASNPDKAVTAIEKLNRLLERDKFCDPETELIRLMNQTTLKPSGPSSQLLPSHCAAVKRLVITPTRTLFYPAEVMCDNRVLRNYDSSRFLCVNVRDEDFSQLSSAAGTIGPVLQRLKDILDQGLDVSGRAFRYLGSSNSQLRNHGCWFVEQELRPNEIRRWMGDFSSIRY